jgi:gliding motility-associated-like protein
MLQFTFANVGEYIVYIDAVDVNGCLASDTVLIRVLSPSNSQLFIPNSFTPNGDGFNDNFKFKYLNIDEFKVEIFNRWGGLVYSSDSIEPGWDGVSINNMPSPEGTYFYIITAKGEDGKNYEQLGSVTLLR